MKHIVKWNKIAEKENIEAAKEYLTLVFTPQDVRAAATKLLKHRKEIMSFKAKDILRAANLQLMPETDEDVRAEFLKVIEGESFAPIILVRKGHELFIGDGFHRTCACYYLDKECKVDAILVGIE